MSVSVIMPYWDRQVAANMAIRLLDAHYAHLDYEWIVVDDGNATPFTPPPGRLNLRVLRLPEKAAPTPQSTTWNRAIEQASGDIIVLNCIEMLHERPVLQQLVDQVREIGPTAYVLAAAWCPELHEWHCHSTHKSAGAPDLPPGTGRAFLGAMRKAMFWEAGGWDEDYMDGAGYEDMDFAHRMLAAGAKFVIRDDLVVIHPKTGASIRWPAAGFARNAELFRSKWC